MKKSLLYFILLLFSPIPIYSQDLSKELELKKEMYGDITIESSELEIKDDLGILTFNVTAPEYGRYYLNAWLTAPVISGEISSYVVAINGSENKFKLKPLKAGWQSTSLTDINDKITQINLNKGINQISIYSKLPEVSKVEFLKLSKNSSDSEISEKNFESFVQFIENNSIYYNSDSEILTRAGTNGQDYTYSLNHPIHFTARFRLACTAGERIKFDVVTNSIGFKTVEVI